MTVVNSYRDKSQFTGQPELVTLFSGDAFNPSIESSVTKVRPFRSGGNGRVVIWFLFYATQLKSTSRVAEITVLPTPPQTKVETNFGLDFDFGVDQLMFLVQQCRFPWLLANVFDPSRGGKVLGEAKQTHLLTASNGLKIGLMGLVERYLP